MGREPSEVSCKHKKFLYSLPYSPIESELIHIGKHKKKKKFEFSKILVSWALLLTTLCVSFSYALSFTDHDPASEVTVAVATACIAIAVAYEAKSFGEKNSRNKYGIEMNAHRMEQDEDDNEDAVG